MKKTALALLLALLTSGALASDDEALKALKESKTEYWLDLLRDVTVDDAQYVIDSSVQIDANGYTLTLNALRTRMRASLQYRKGAS